MLSSATHTRHDSALRSPLTGSQAGCMARTTDPRTKEIARKLTRIARRKDVSQNKLAEAGGIKPTQWSGVIHGRAGISLERLFDVAAHLGMTIDVVESSADHPTLVGSVVESGLLEVSGSWALPGLVEIETPFAEFLQGDRLLLVPGSFTSGAWMAVKGPDDRTKLWKGAERASLSVLVSVIGESLIFDPSLHQIVAVAEELRRGLKP